MAKKPNRMAWHGMAWQPPIRWVCRQCNRQYSGEHICPFCYCVDKVVAASERRIPILY